MKRIYYQPTCVVVVLSTRHIMLTESLPVITPTDDDDPVIDDANQILTKESRSIWDDEW